jgi:hypothetical protein
MLFERRLREGIDQGSISLMFRRWKRPQVMPGHRYRTGTAIIEVDRIDEVSEREITDHDVLCAGYASPRELRQDLRGDAATPLFRIAFHRVDQPDPRDVLANDARLEPDDIAELNERLAHLDGRSHGGPWTEETLRAIADRPGTRAAELASALERDIASFKADVRKLKALGLTKSLTTGYELSPRGAAYVALVSNIPT